MSAIMDEEDHSNSGGRKRPVDEGFDLGQMLRDAFRKKIKSIDDNQHDQHECVQSSNLTFFEKMCEDNTKLEGLVNIMRNHDESDWYMEVHVLLEEVRIRSRDIKATTQILIDVKNESFANNEFWERWFDQKLLRSGSKTIRQKEIEDSFSIDVANWSRDPSELILEQAAPPGVTDRMKKVPEYTAISGASGSGKTWTMFYLMLSTVMKHIKTHQQHNKDWGKFCLPVYITGSPCGNKPSINDFVKATLHRLADNHADAHDNKVENILKTWSDQAKNTILILTLDEVADMWDHGDYRQLPAYLMETFHFKNIVLLVGSTLLSLDVLRQPTNAYEVLNVRMKPIDEEFKMKQLFKFHVSRHKKLKDGDWTDSILNSMPVLFELLVNHRCAKLCVDALADLLGTIDDDDELQKNAWGEGNSRALLTVVASKYRKSNALRDLAPEVSRDIMLRSLALVSVQKIVDDAGVQKNPDDNSLAANTVDLIGHGLVERAILPDKPVQDNRQRVHVDGGRFEFQMSTALTLICVQSIMPWIEGISDSADHFKALVACMMVVLRYAQTGRPYDVKHISQGVPYSGNEKDVFWKPNDVLRGTCLINGPQAPYADVILGENSCDLQSNLLSELLTNLASEKFPRCCVLVQCKKVDTEKAIADCDFHKEMAKMGLGLKSSEHEQSITILQNDSGVTDKEKKQFKSGKWLTTEWVVNSRTEVHDQIAVAFVTNGLFGKDNQPKELLYIESKSDCDYAWKCLYPLDQLVRNRGVTPDAFCVGRIQCQGPTAI